MARAATATKAGIESPLLARLSQKEVLVAPEGMAWFESCLRAVIDDERAETLLSIDSSHMANGQDEFWPAEDSWEAKYKPYVVQDGILKVPVMGVLLNRFSYQLGSYATGYTYIQRAIERGMADMSVRGIALIIDSPGGEVAGNFELVDKLYAMRGEKPIRAFAADHAYSAAYSIASVAKSITMTRSGGVGSIGVVTMHVDYSGALDKAGIKLTYIFAGKHKVDGNPYEKLPDNVRERIQKRIDATYGIFVATVSRNRGLDEQVVRDTEAATFGAAEALEIGLADSVATFEDAIAAYADDLRNPGDDEMTDKTAQTDTVTAAAHQAAVSAAATTARQEGATAERSRITAIMGLDESKTRRDAAFNIATGTDMTVDQAKTLLAALPETKTEAAAPAAGAAGAAGKVFEAAMANGNPEVGASSDAGKQDEKVDASASILSSYGAATGFKPKAK